MRERRKYHNVKVKADGYTFDSKAEYEFYRLLLADDDIADIKVHPRFLLIEGYVNAEGVKRRARYYVSDFLVRYKDGSEEIIDVKGLVTDLFKLKRDIFEHKYGKTITIWKVGDEYVGRQPQRKLE